MQSFDPALLHVLERWHEPSSVPRAVDLARDAGFENLNLDLIFAIPGQTLSGLEADLDAALALQPEHLSCYNLMYEPNTAMTQRLKQGRFTPVDEDTERAMYQLIREHLAAAGFEQYEISNWARPGRRCRHNLHYWRNANWLGFGPSAASHVAGWRWKNVPRLQAYLDSVEEPPVQDVEHLSAERRAGEALMLRLRLLEGVELTWLASLLSAEDPRWRVITDLEQVGMLERTASHLRLTESGLMIADHVVGELL